MKLREHPLFTRKSGMCSWPPQWQPILNENQVITGEIGVLEDVSMHSLIPNKIFLAMRYSADRYVAVIAFDDPTFAKQLYTILAKNIGRKITEVGDLDLSALF